MNKMKLKRQTVMFKSDNKNSDVITLLEGKDTDEFSSFSKYRIKVCGIMLGETWEEISN